jgi:hypothetical protein
MSAKLTMTLAAAGVGAVTAVAILGTATPAFAKAGETFSGPGVVRAGHAFRLVVEVGDDAGAQPASSRLEVLGAHGRYQWLGAWHRLRLLSENPSDWESYSFTVTERHPGTYTFRAVISSYPSPGPIRVLVR